VRYYKILDKNGWSPIANYKWYLPTRKERPGKWMPKVETLQMCSSGYHVCKKPLHILQWGGDLAGNEAAVFEAEIRGKKVEGATKVVAQQARLLKKLDFSSKDARSLSNTIWVRLIQNIYRFKSGLSNRDGITITKVMKLLWHPPADFQDTIYNVLTGELEDRDVKMALFPIKGLHSPNGNEFQDLSYTFLNIEDSYKRLFGNLSAYLETKRAIAQLNRRFR
jgi:hypothetical protein